MIAARTIRSVLVTPSTSPKRIAVRLPLYDARLRDEDHAEAEHADEEQADPGVLGEGRLPVDQVDAPDHHKCRDRRTDQRVEADEDGEGDPRDHAVDQRITEERHPADHDPGPDDRGRRAPRATLPAALAAGMPTRRARSASPCDRVRYSGGACAPRHGVPSASAIRSTFVASIPISVSPSVPGSPSEPVYNSTTATS